MFPRGAGNLQEVPPDLVKRCSKAIHDEEDPVSSQHGTVVGTLVGTMAETGIGWEYLSTKDWCRTMLTCKLALLSLRHKHEWLAALGYKLIKHPLDFSPATLLGILLQNPAFSGEAWRTPLLTGNVYEGTRAGAASINLVALPTPEDARAFWSDRLKGLLRLPNFPTDPQAEETRRTVGLLVDRSTGAGLSALMEACLSVEKPNSTIGPIILAEIIDIAPRMLPPWTASAGAQRPSADATGVLPAASEEQTTTGKCGRTMITEEESKNVELLDHKSMSSLLARCGVASIRTLVMLMGGIPVNSLKADVKTLPKLKGIGIPRSVRRAMVGALAKSSWFSLLTVFRFDAFFKGLFKSIHIVDVLKDREGNLKTEPDKAKVYLLQAILRGQQYPRTQADFDALTKAGKPWDKLIAAPLALIAEDPLFWVADSWKLPTFQKGLAHKKIPMPQCTSVESMLCAYGNRRVTWYAIFECGEITSRQILRNVVSLAMMDFPVGVVEAQLLKSVHVTPLADLLKTYNVLKKTFTLEEVEALSTRAHKEASRPIEEGQGADGASGDVVHSWAPQRKAKRAKKGRGASKFLSNASGGENVASFKHPEPPSVKTREKRVEDGTNTCSQATAEMDVADGVLANVAGTKATVEAGKVPDLPADEVRVVRECGVADKKGQRHQINRAQTVSTRFGQASVDAYVSLLSSALSRRMELFATPAVGSSSARASAKPSSEGFPFSAAFDQRVSLEKGTGSILSTGNNKDTDSRGREGRDTSRSVRKDNVLGVISYTEELSKNVVRSGIPPSLPKFTNVTIWRGEDVCLNQLGAGNMEELLVGINWCQPEGSRSSVDLDLAIMVYDSEWKHLAYCSYDTPNLCIAGVQHSGDVVSAPYPGGGRESCTINFAALRAGFPNARYVVLGVYSYTRQKWDDLEDASIFVANPHERGSGPGGMSVICAARLTGAATTSIAGYLHLPPMSMPEEPVTDVPFGIRRTSPKGDPVEKPVYEKDVRVHFVFTDQEGRIEHGGHAAHGSSGTVGKILSKIHESRTKSGAQTLADAAAFQAALVCDSVYIVADGVKKRGAAERPHVNNSSSLPSLDSLVRLDGEGRFEFYQRIAKALDLATPAVPAAGRQSGSDNYPAEIFEDPRAVVSRGGGDEVAPPGAQHTLFFGGDLDDWLEVTRRHGMHTKAKGKARLERSDCEGAGGAAAMLTLVNLRSAEKGVTNADDAGVSRVDGATAYEELVEVVHG